MSIQPYVDPYVGRCKNIRPSNDGERDTSRRCLEMDGHQSACRFGPEPQRYINYTNFYSSSAQSPTPWIVPPEIAGPDVVDEIIDSTNLSLREKETAISEWLFAHFDNNPSDNS